MHFISRLEASPVDAVQGHLYLRHWHWLIPIDFSVVCVTKLGDAFLRDPHGSIWCLDVGSAELTLVAANDAQWEALAQDESTRRFWSGHPLVAQLESSGLSPAPGECYTYLTSPILGGTYEPSNFKVVPVQTHFDIWGPIHEKLKDLPDGSQIRFVVVP